VSVPTGTMADMAAFGSVRPPLVGRDDELQLLLGLVGASGEGRPAAVLLAGDAGVGKTRLLAQVAADVSVATMVVRGGCVDLGEVALPYLPFVEAFADLVRQAPEVADVPGLGPLLPGALPAGGELARLQLFEAVVAALRLAGELAPVVLVLEDLHWADASSRELLRFLLARLRDERVTVLASYRADDLHRKHPLVPLVAELTRLAGVQHVELRPLADEAVRRHLEALAPELAGPLLDAVVRRAEGNAYFAEELLLAVAEDGDRDGRALPSRLSEVLLARVERLDERTLAVVRLAAAAGRRVEHEVLAAACAELGLPVDEALREAVAAHVLVVTPGVAAGSYAFRHALLQETVYDDLLPGERVRLHGLLARVLTTSGVGAGPGELGFHRERSGDLKGALEDYLAAADQAMCHGAPHEALALRERALTLVESGGWPGIGADDRARLLSASATAAGHAGEWGRAVTLAKSGVQAAAELGPGPRAEAHEQLARHLMAADRDQHALDEARLAHELAHEAGDARLLAVSAATYARALSNFLDRDDAVRSVAESALQLGTAEGLLEVQADALITLGRLDETQGDSESACDRYCEARDVAAKAGDVDVELRAAYNVAAVSFYAGDLELAGRRVDTAVGRADALGLGWSPYGVSVRSLQTVVRYTFGDLEGSAAAAMTAHRAGPGPAVESLAAMGLYAAVARGDADAIARAEAVALVPDVDPLAVLVAAGAGADALRMAGEPARASALARDGARRVTERWGEWSLAGIWLAAHGIAAQADLAAQARERRDAGAEAAAVASATEWEDLAQQTAVRGRPRGGALGPEGRAWLLRTTAELSRARGASDPALWTEVVAAFDYGYVYELARSRWRLAEALVGAGDRAAAAEDLQAAAATAVALGTGPFLHDVVALARRGRLDLGDTVRVARAGTSGLTPREREVLTLVAEGLTNRQIGERLFMSEKTASVHVSRILAKLEVSGRAEAAAKATRMGLL
jgi:DNA-binding CsgD family transcriptional regulator